MNEGSGEPAGWDFFVSYTQADRAWAEWIAWLLEEDGYRVLIQAWDMVPGSNWISRMDQGVQRASRTLVVLSPDYLSSVYGSAEWQAAWAADPHGRQRKLIIVRVRGERLTGLLTGVVGIDLAGLSESLARCRLRNGIAAAVRGRAKPDTPPPFPLRVVPVEPQFPGARPEVFTAPGRNPHFTGRATSTHDALQAEEWDDATSYEPSITPPEPTLKGWWETLWSCERPTFAWWWTALWSRETLRPKTRTERLHSHAVLSVPLPICFFAPPLVHLIPLCFILGIKALYSMNRDGDYGREFQAAAWAISRGLIGVVFWLAIFVIAFLSVLFGDSAT